VRAATRVKPEQAPKGWMRAPSLLSLDEGRRGRSDRPTHEDCPARRGSGRSTYARGDWQHGRPVAGPGGLGTCARGGGARPGARGVDGIRFAQIEAYGVTRWLGELREEVRTGRYSPQPVRRVMIPKSGGVGQRPLGIPTIRDRVVQTAAKLVIEPIFEADFDEAAYGYRPRRSAHEAIRIVHKAIDDGRTEVVDADLSQYLDAAPYCPPIHGGL